MSLNQMQVIDSNYLYRYLIGAHRGVCTTYRREKFPIHKRGWISPMNPYEHVFFHPHATNPDRKN